MRQLTADEVRQLQHGQAVYVRLSRLCAHGNHIEYEGMDTLYVQRHPKTGEIVTITTQQNDWAESDPRHDITAPDGALVTEDWCMEIFEP